MVYAQQKDLQKAVTDLDRAIQLNPKDSESYNMRAILRIASKDITGGMSDWDKSLEINPNSPEVYTTRGIFRVQFGDRQNGIADLKKGADLFLQQGKTEMYQQTQQLIKKYEQ
jgi:regulator of sirC expression with transglutaminase-like and TPR domain